MESTSKGADYCHAHNLVEPERAGQPRPWGIRVSLPDDDPFVRLVGRAWEKFHWYPTEAERDRAFGNMTRRHPYYRIGDEPNLIYEKVRR